MANSRKVESRVALPPPGAAFLFPVPGGRFGVCRVLRHAEGDELRWMGRTALVAIASWTGTEPPSLDDPALREPLRLTHHAAAGRLAMGFVGEAPPEHLQYLGQIPPTAEERALTCDGMGQWDGSDDLVLQWRWDHDREALLAEEAAREAAERAERQRVAELEARRRETLTWEGLRAKERFVAWEASLVPEVVAASRRLFVEAIDALASLGPRPHRRRAAAVVNALVEGFNRLQAEHHFIETLERERICIELEELAFLAGLDDPLHVADARRTW